MNKRYWWIIIIYFIGQLLPAFFIELISRSQIAVDLDISFASIIAMILCDILTLFAAILLMKKEIVESLHYRSPLIGSREVKWIFGGVILAFTSQITASIIEALFRGGVSTASENTELITTLLENYPIMLFLPVIFAPVMEELIFRKFLFGTLQNKIGFFWAACISSLIFGAMHLELEHLLVYASIGFVFAFLYKKTNRILVPILAHAIMNGTVMLIQLI